MTELPKRHATALYGQGSRAGSPTESVCQALHGRGPRGRGTSVARVCTLPTGSLRLRFHANDAIRIRQLRLGLLEGPPAGPANSESESSTGDVTVAAMSPSS